MSLPATLDPSKFLEQNKAAIANALPKHMNADRMLRIMLTEFRKNPALSRCSQQSLMKCLVETSQYGLEPGVMGQTYLIPYKDECTLIIGYRGLITLAHRSGQVKALYVEAVYEGDEFEVQFGTEMKMMHRPMFKSNVATHYYAVFKNINGGEQFSVMSREQVEVVRTRFSKAPNSPAWRDSFDEMAKKTVLRRLIKTIPVSIDLMDAIASEDEKYSIDVEAFDPTQAQANFKALHEAQNNPKKAESEAEIKQFMELSEKAILLKINTDSLYQNPEQALMYDTKKLHAINVILQQQIDRLGAKNEPTP